MTLNNVQIMFSSNSIFLLIHNSGKCLICLPVVSRQHLNIFPHIPLIWEWPGTLNANLGGWVWGNNSLGKSHSPYSHCLPQRMDTPSVASKVAGRDGHTEHQTDPHGGERGYSHPGLYGGSGSCLLPWRPGRAHITFPTHSRSKPMASAIAIPVSTISLENGMTRYLGYTKHPAWEGRMEESQ